MKTTKTNGQKVQAISKDFTSNLAAIHNLFELTKKDLAELRRLKDSELPELKLKFGKFGSFKASGNGMTKEFLKGAEKLMVNISYNPIAKVVYYADVTTINHSKKDFVKQSNELHRVK